MRGLLRGKPPPFKAQTAVEGVLGRKSDRFGVKSSGNVTLRPELGDDEDASHPKDGISLLEMHGDPELAAESGYCRFLFDSE
jgi:hypothetical protein